MSRAAGPLVTRNHDDMTLSRLTVAICTWNRCHLLQQTLEEMTKMTVPTGVDWELVVVNNNCSDATDEVIASFARRLRP